ncbi:hypothetical protein [Enterobacter hormaechei]|uniref:hypothetical protein n=1 Tax=Enterobacter hormaechei TaxID=158836 RepID=UPI000BB87A9E|nr:hypothetical protein [Enterobacter hormaechei]
MSLRHDAAVPGMPHRMTGYNAETKDYDEDVNRLCKLYPEIASWQPELIAGAWRQWCVENQLQPIAPEKRDEAFPLYLVRLIRNRMEEMNAWR